MSEASAKNAIKQIVPQQQSQLPLASSLDFIVCALVAHILKFSERGVGISTGQDDRIVYKYVIYLFPH